MTVATSRCSYLLRPELVTCNKQFIEHGNGTGHVFQARYPRKAHIPTGAVMLAYFCGRRYQTDEARVEVTDQSEPSVRQAALENVLCQSCFKQWVFIQTRAAFLLRARLRIGA